MSAVTDLKNQAERDNLAVENGIIEPIFDWTNSSAGRFLNTDPPERKFLIDDFIPFGETGAISAPGGSSKSQLALQIAISVSCGKPVFEGWNVCETGNVLCLMAEESEDELHRRIHAIGSKFSISAQHKIERRLHAVSVVGESNLMTRRAPNFEIEPTDYVDRLKASIPHSADPKLIIIDPVSRFRGGDENTAQDATRFVEQVERLRVETGATVLLIHHANKSSSNGEMSQNMLRGSSAFVDAVRFAIGLSTFSDADAKAYEIDPQLKGYYARLKMIKSNYTPPMDAEIVLHRDNRGILVRESLIRTRDKQAIDLKFEIPLVIKQESDQGIIHSRSSFLKKFAGKTKQFGVGKNVLVNTIDGLIAQKLLQIRGATREEKSVNRNLRNILCSPEKRTGGRQN